jgi:hypothetical protein
MAKNKTPLKSIRKNCLSCCNNSSLEIRLCPCNDCLMFHLRMGRKTIKGSTIKRIKRFCLDCGGGTPQKVRACEFEDDCYLFPYRNGESPAHKAVWVNKPKRPLPRKKRSLLG